MEPEKLQDYDTPYLGYIIRRGLIGDWFVGRHFEDGRIHFVICCRSEAAAKRFVRNAIG